MRKAGFTILFSLLIFSSFAQGVRLGLSASPQVAWLKSDVSSVKKDGSVMGFNFGLNTDFFFAERYSFSSGLFINNTGGNLAFDNPTSFTTSDSSMVLPANSSVRYKIQYIEIPFAFHMESNKIGYFVYHGQIGLTSQVRVGATANINASDDTYDVEGVGVKDEIAFFNMGYHICLGADYYFSKNTALTMGVTYTNGFIDVTKETDDNVSLRSIALKVGILF